MPLLSGSSEQTMSKNIEELRNSGYGEKQAAAIAYHKAGKDAVSKRSNDINGWVEIKDNPISKVGIFPYLGSSISRELEPSKVYMIYRPEEELSDPECIASFKLLPWINDHEMLGSREEGLTPAEEKGVEGVIGENVYFDYPYLRGNLKMFSESLANVVNSGKKELSAAYQATYEMISGVFEGQHYDGIQRKLRGNHLATVEQGRSGKDVAVLDHFKFTIDSTELSKMTTENYSEKKEEGDEGLNDSNIIDQMKELHGKFEELKAMVAGLGAKKAEDESEEKKTEDEAEETEDEFPEKKAEDEKEEGKTMDGVTRKEFEAFKKHQATTFDASMKSFRLEVNKVNELSDLLSTQIGTFDHSEMTLADVARYGLKKLNEMKGAGLTCDSGEELATVRGYLAAVKSMPLIRSSVSDSSIAIGKYPATQAYLSRLQGVKK